MIIILENGYLPYLWSSVVQSLKTFKVGEKTKKYDTEAEFFEKNAFIQKINFTKMKRRKVGRW